MDSIGLLSLEDNVHSAESNASLATRVLSLALYHQVGAEQSADVFPLAAELGLRRLTELGGAQNSSQAGAGEAASGDGEASSGAAAAPVEADTSDAGVGLVIVEVMEGPMSFQVPLLPQYKPAMVEYS